MDLNQIKGIVKKFLEECPETRDDDNLLILKVWSFQQPKLRHTKTTFVGFAEEFLKGRFFSTESIRRSRQKLQEQNENLRGENYYKRKGVLETKVRNQIKDWEN